MGGAIGDGLGKIGDFFTKGAGEVAGTGQTAAELADAGVGADTLKLLPQAGMSTGQRFAKAGLGMAGGAFRGLNQGQQGQQAGGAAPIQSQPQPTLANQFDPNYLDAWKRRSMMSDAPENGNWTGLPSQRPTGWR